MKETKFTIPSPVDALPISCLLVEPDEVKGLVLLTHGLSEYKDRYLPLMRCFAEDGFACAICDQRGNGESMRAEGDFGCVYGAGAEGILQDVHALGKELVGRYPSKKLFLYGHSTGSLITLCYMKRWCNEISGVILSALPENNPALGAGKAYLKLKKTFKGAAYRDPAVQKLMASSYAIKGESSTFAWLNSDPARVRQYEDDPFCGQLGTVEGYLALLDIMQTAYDKKGWDKANPLCPIFIAVGENDPCADGEKGASAGEAYLKGAHFVKVEHKTYPGMRHELHNEPSAPAVVHDSQNKLLGWL
ncbi:MAG: alpha/beta fold hydrolase [Clostridia bacterium]|nr:alpha/beta fold hydrolase [Clostridia bacterium]